jgi:hypothetical protein
LGAGLGGIADTVGFPVLLDVSCDGPHMVMAKATTAIPTARPANLMSRGLTRVVVTHVSPILR